MATAKRAKAPKWQFPFFNHGLWSYRDEIKSAHWYVVFEQGVPEADRASVLAGAPPPCAGPAHWGGDRIVLLESPPDRYFDAHVWRTYGPQAAASDEDDEEEDFELTKNEAQAFVAALDAWLDELHHRSPIAVVIGSRGSPKDPWSKWSVEQLSAHVIPSLRTLLASQRPPAEETRQLWSPERLAAWVVWQAVASFFELHDAKELDEAQRGEMAALTHEAKGHDEMLDPKLDRILRMLAKASTQAT